ncbi:MAG: YdcF family protein [archaeon]|nr:YdcF family protein [archaeon]
MASDEKKIGVIVLGQSLNPDSSAPSTLTARVSALVAWTDERCGGEVPNFPIVLSGGDPAKTGRSEAEVMAELVLAERPAWEAALVLEKQALNTVQNAWFGVPILRARGVREAFVLSSEFHMPRSLYIFETVDLFCQGTPSFDSLLAIAAATPPSDGDGSNQSTINAMGLSQRLSLERDLLQHHTFSRTHVDGVFIPPPSKERLEIALSQLREMQQLIGAASSCYHQQ